MNQRILSFLEEGPWAVVGASNDRAKYGNKVLRCYMQKGKTPVYPVNPHAQEIEGLAAYPSLGALPRPARAASIITPPEVTETVVREAAELGIRYLWMQPGAESPRAIQLAQAAGIELIAGGPCLLVVLGYRE
jgi:predicted CoA-binding protein